MISSIYIDGYALWVVIGLFVLAVAGVIFLGCAYSAELYRNESLNRRLGLFKIRLRNEISKAYQRGYDSALHLRDKGSAEKDDRNVQM